MKTFTESQNEIIRKVQRDSERIEKRYNINEGSNMMDAVINPTPSGGMETKSTSGGDVQKAQRIIDLMLELRKAREAIESQLTEIKSQAKSKISALRGSENALLDALEEKDQMTLFEVDPSVSDEVKSIIDDPTI
jgi:CHASE3 domain sensor protein